MDFLSTFLERFVAQLQSPTLGFLIGGMVIAAVNSKLSIPDAVYKFIVFMLLIKVGLSGGLAIRDANLVDMLLPALFATAIGILIVFIGRYTLAKMPNVKMVDAIATAGLFGAVSGSTLAAALTLLDQQDIFYEAWAAALYPFMDISALVTAIVVASIYSAQQKDAAERAIAEPVSVSAQDTKQKQLVTAGGYPSSALGIATGRASSDQGIVASGYPRKEKTAADERVKVWPIIKDSLQGSALSALLLGIALGILTDPRSVFESFYEANFRGLLSVLMLVMGMEATARIGELRKVGQWYALYAFVAPLLHGLIAFGLGMIAHELTGFSLGGVVLLAVIASSSSDISGPPTLRAGIPSANPSAYIGASTAVGTPVALALGIPIFIGLAQAFAN